MSSRSALAFLAGASAVLGFSACKPVYSDTFSYKKNSFQAPTPKPVEIKALTLPPVDPTAPPAGGIPAAPGGIPGAGGAMPDAGGLPGVPPAVPGVPPAVPGL